MKTCKKLFALLMVAAMILSLSVTAFADKTNPGKITITNAVNGDEYTAFKVFDVEYSADKASYIYSTSSDAIAKAAKDSGLFTVGEKAEGKYPVALVSGKTAEDIVAWLNGEGIVSLFTEKKSATASGASLVIDDLALGYYFVKDTTSGAAKTAISLNTTDPTVEIIDKNDLAPKADDEFKTAENAFVGVGETADFTLGFYATNYEVKNGESKPIAGYSLTDKPVNMKVDVSSVKVYIDGSETALAADKYNVIYIKGVLTVDIPWMDGDDFLYGNGVDVKVCYSALVVDLDASNEASLAYKLKGADDPTDITPDDGNEVDIENGSITIDANVSGGSYELKDKDGNKIDLVEVEEGVFRPYVEGEDDEKDIYDGELSDDDVIKGLGAGDYTVAELDAPNGYNPAGDAKVTIKDEEGKSDVTATFTYQAGAVLPTTGGAGTMMLLVVGSILFVGTAIVLVTKKRMYNEGN